MMAKNSAPAAGRRRADLPALQVETNNATRSPLALGGEEMARLQAGSEFSSALGDVASSEFFGQRKTGKLHISRSRTASKESR